MKESPARTKPSGAVSVGGGRLRQVLADMPKMPGEPNRAVVMHRMGIERAIATAE
jgi:hypothetical protein